MICLLACWPLTFGVFSVKNDALHYFLPYRFNISEALRNGELPFWSPYIYQGYPVYGDMQSGAWNPVVWIFSLIGRYDLTLFHWENLLYVFLSGVGMYKLAFRYSRHSQTALLAGVSYMLSGFMLSGQLINWLAAGAFIPFVLYYYLQTISSGKPGHGIKTGISLYLLFVAGYPSFFILTGYLLIVIGLARLYDIARGRGISLKSFMASHLILLLVFAGLAMPAIISYIDLLPYYQRGAGTTFAEAAHNSFSVQHLSSLFFPSSIHATDLVTGTDVTCRNVFIGIFPVVILVAYPPALTKRNTWLMLLVLFAFLFSLGDAFPLRRLTFEFIPLMDSFRHPSQARLFMVIGLILLAVPGIKKLLDRDRDRKKNSVFIRAAVFTACVLVVTTIATMYSTLLEPTPKQSQGMTARFKAMIESMTIADTVALNGMIQLVFLAFFLWWLIKKNYRPGLLAAAWIANLVIMAQFVLPLTFVSQTSAASINKVIRNYPGGFPVEGLHLSLQENSSEMDRHFEKMGSVLFYNKKPGISRLTNTPAFLTRMDTLLADTSLYDYIASRPVTYLAQAAATTMDSLHPGDSTCGFVLTESAHYAGPCDANAEAMVTGLGANLFEIKTKSAADGILVLLQSHHHSWKAWIDDKPVAVQRVNIAFMGVEVPKGAHTIVFKFVPGRVKNLLWLQVFTLVALLGIAIWSWQRKQRLRVR